MSTRPIRTGGLYRCCIESIRAYKGEEIPGVTEIKCITGHPSNLPQARLTKQGIWEWTHNE